MKNTIRRLPDAELEVMQAVWACEPPAARAKIDAILQTTHPIALTTLLLCDLIYSRIRTAPITLGFCFGDFSHICVYYLLLLPLLPLLCRQISARVCAMLWMLPNYLYIAQMSYMRLAEPRWVVSAPSGLVRALFALWLAGFLAVMGWKIVSHLVFRAHILRDAVPVTDPEVLETWRQKVKAARFRKPKFRLVVSPAAGTPLSVGLFGSAVRVVLPQREYTPDELRLPGLGIRGGDRGRAYL